MTEAYTAFRKNGSAIDTHNDLKWLISYFSKTIFWVENSAGDVVFGTKPTKR